MIANDDALSAAEKFELNLLLSTKLSTFNYQPSFILRYAGAGVTFRSGDTELVPDHQADRWPTEQDAWYAAYRQDLNPDRCRVEIFQPFIIPAANGGGDRGAETSHQPTSPTPPSAPVTGNIRHGLLAEGHHE